MKNIGIITYHRATNYGAVLQAYSLVNRLKNDFPNENIEIVDYSSVDRSKKHIKEVIKAFKNNGLKSGFNAAKKKRVFSEFSNNLPVSKKKVVSDDIKDVMQFMDERYDVVISGSDAVFNWGTMPFPTAYLLGEPLHCKKMSYAASAHRLFYRDLSREKIEYCGKAFSDYTFMGIRDAETESFVEFCAPNTELHHTCDPSFFIDIKAIRDKCRDFNIEKAFGIVNNKPLIIVMSPDTAIGLAIVDKYSATHNVVSLFVQNKAIKHHCGLLTPFEWANVFGCAEITVTEYFHASIFSLLNGTPIVSIDKLGRNQGYEGKIHDLLFTRLNIPEFYINSDDIADGGIEKIISSIEKVMVDNYSERIATAIELEKQSYTIFRNTLKENIAQDK